MKKLILLALVLCSAATMLAQTNRMSYQAVVRNSANELVAEENLTVAISISDANGTSVYSETHSVTSNRNGVISLMIGEGSSQSGNMTSVDWRTAQIHTVISLPDGATLSNTTPVNAVPYAFYADSVDVQWVSDVVDDYLEHHSISSIVETDPTVPDWAKETTKPAYDYSEIVNTPDLNGYLTAETDPTVPDWAKEANKPAYDYSEIENTPTIPTVPTNVGDFYNDAGYITAADIPAIPNNVSTFNNDANYITNSNTSCANSVDLCELLEKLQQLENQLEFKILTEGVTAVTQNSFTVNGKVQTDGSSTVTQRGFVYSSSNPTPSISDYRVNCGSGTGTYSYTVTGLTPGITYYVRAFATNENGTFYGSVVAVTTTATSPSTLPSVTTIAVTNVTTTEATVTGTVTSDGGEPVTQRGFVYGTEPNPTLSSTVANHGTGTGNFSNLLTNLLSGETYYVRAFATNSLGTAYGNQITFVTSVPTTVEGDAIPCPGTPTVTDHEGNVYNTVQIGTQCWTKENMRATTSPSTGTYLIPPAGTSPTYTGKQAWWYDNDSATYAPRNYGLLYNWNAAVDTFDLEYGEISLNGNNGFGLFITGNHRGICPEGWHVPTGGEWDQLTEYLNRQEEYRSGSINGYLGKSLASTIDWEVSSTPYVLGNDLAANNASGFNALPAGIYDNGSDVYMLINTHAWFWSTSYSANGAHAHSCRLESNRPEVFVDHGYAINMCSCASVRCLRDSIGATSLTVTTISVTNVTTNEATVSASVTSESSEPVTQRGFVYGTQPNPSLFNSTVAEHGTGTGNFSNLLTGLLSGETYYVRAFATNSVGTAYGNQITFTTSVPTPVAGDAIPCPGTPTVTDHEGNVYNTVQIGTQCWTKENMRATTSPTTGTYLIPPAGTALTYSGKQARWLNDDSATYAPKNYGLLYNWNAALDTFNTEYGETSLGFTHDFGLDFIFTNSRRGICPYGWHLPSNEEWIQLNEYLNGHEEYRSGGVYNNIAKALASTNFWHNSDNNYSPGNVQSNNNLTGFNAVPSTSTDGQTTSFWTTTLMFEDGYSWTCNINYNSPQIDITGWSFQNQCYSVRCLRD